MSLGGMVVHRKAKYVASARIAFLSVSSACPSLPLVDFVFKVCFDGRIDLSKYLVDAIVDIDLRDDASFSGIVLVLVRVVESMIFDVRK